MQVELRQLSVRHPAARPDAPDALAQLSLSIASGEQVAVIGPSGSGKTTLLHAMACSLRPVGGSMTFLSSNAGTVNPWKLNSRQLQRLRGQLVLAPQVPPLPPRQRVVTAVLAGRLAHMSFWESLMSLFYPKKMADAQAALARFDLAEKLFDRVDRLSGGERQRVGLARLLLANAQLVLVDEPLSALDPTRSSQALQSLMGFAKESSATLICTLHQVPTALAHFPRIIGLRDGRLAFDCKASEVSEEMLNSLYANKLEELSSPVPLVSEENSLLNADQQSAPAVMHCR